MPVGHPRSKHPVLLVVWCGQCTTARHKNRGRLGHIERQEKLGRVWVSAYNTGSKSAFGKVRRAPGFLLIDHILKRGKALPDQFHASCPRHGIGTIPTVDVIDSRGTVVIDLNTARA